VSLSLMGLEKVAEKAAVKKISQSREDLEEE
jgi:hypothetical protein